jgi:deazaflavin-dependent oxidoreductase (nitroreductase family)
MWFMNKIANPFVRLVLRSPLHGLMSAELLLITYRGKKSGKGYTLPVQYAQAGKKIYIIPGWPQKKTWWRNLKGGLPVKITLRGQEVAGNGIVLEQPQDAAEILFGMQQKLHNSAQLAKMYNVRFETDGSLNAEDLRQAAAGVIMIRVELA